MAYNNSFFYDRDNSVDDKYKYIYDLSSYEPVYGSSVTYNSRLNFLQTIDNSLKILPASENNLNISFNLKFLLGDQPIGDLLKTIEVAGATKYLKFKDPSNLYKDFVGYVEKYSVNKTSANLSEVNIELKNYGVAPEFKWRTSSLFKEEDVSNYKIVKLAYPPSRNVAQTPDVWPPYYPGDSFDYKKHSVVYYSNYEAKSQARPGDSVGIYNINATPDPGWPGLGKYFDVQLTPNTPPKSKTKMNDFWFCYKHSPAIPYGIYNGKHDYYLKVYAVDIDTNYWTKNFYFETKYPFILENEIDVYKLDYKNSFVQNVKHKQNTNVLKQFSLRFENIEDDECKAMLLFLEKKCGYKRFIYEFPIFMKRYKVFVCNQWNHVFKYKNCHDITLQLIEDPNPNIFYTSDNKPYLL
jgi:phage-related protein